MLDRGFEIFLFLNMYVCMYKCICLYIYIYEKDFRDMIFENLYIRYVKFVIDFIFLIKGKVIFICILFFNIKMLF